MIHENEADELSKSVCRARLEFVLVVRGRFMVCGYVDEYFCTVPNSLFIHISLS